MKFKHLKCYFLIWSAAANKQALPERRSAAACPFLRMPFPSALFPIAKRQQTVVWAMLVGWLPHSKFVIMSTVVVGFLPANRELAMKIAKFNRMDCLEARGVAVVIDVIRAFTTAAYAFASGIEKIFVVSQIEEAFAYRKHNPDYLLMGEIQGELIEGFDFGNSPLQFGGHSISQRTLVQRTTSGTQGVVAAVNADVILPASFVVAEATLERIRALQPEQVSFIITGQNDGSEDLALADYLEARLLGQNPDSADYMQRVKNSPQAQKVLTNPRNRCCSLDDLLEVLRIDKYPFALEIRREPEGMAMYPVHACGRRWNPSLVAVGA